MVTVWSPRGARRTLALCVGASILAWPSSTGVAEELIVTQVTVDAVVESQAGDVQADQLVIEVGTPSAAGDVVVDQVAIEVGIASAAGDVVVDQLVIEIIRPESIEMPPEDDDDDRGAIGPIVWLEWPRTGDSPVTTDVYSDLDLQDPPDYYAGFKPAQLTQLGHATRVLSDPWSGDWQGGQYRCQLIDREHAITRRKASAFGRFWTTPLTVRMVNRAARARLDTPWTVWIGPLIDAQPSGLHWDLTLGDIVSQTLLSDTHQCPWRVVGDGLIGVLEEFHESLDLQTPEPIIYGNHFRVPDVDPASPEGFVYRPTVLGKRTVGGTPYWVWIIAGHAIKDIPAIRIDNVETGEGSDWLIPTHAAHTTAFGTSYEDIESYAFPGVFRRYTLLYGAVGATDPEAVVAGESVLTVAVSGIETVGDGTGLLITDRFLQYKHFAINFVANYGLNSYQSGPWLTNPTWSIYDADVPIVDSYSFDDCAAIGVERLPDNGGYIGAAIIGARPGDRDSVRRWIADWNRSCGCQFGITHRGRIRVTLLHPTAAIKAAAPIYLAATEILTDSFTTRFDWPGQATHIRFRADLEHADQRWRTEGVVIHATAEDYGAIPSPLREYPFAPGITAANHLAVIEGRIRAHPPQVVTLAGTIGPDPVTGASLGYVDLGEYLQYQHYAAVGSAAQIRLGQVTGVTIETDTRRVVVTLLDCEDLIDFDAFEGGS